MTTQWLYLAMNLSKSLLIGNFEIEIDPVYTYGWIRILKIRKSHLDGQQLVYVAT